MGTNPERQGNATGDRLLGTPSPLTLTGRFLDYKDRATPVVGGAGYGTASSWWTAAWREGNLITAGLNYGTDLFILGGLEDSPVVDEATGLTRFEDEFNKEPEAFLGQYAAYTDDFPELMKSKSLGELNYRKFMVSRDLRERAALDQSGTADDLLPFLMVGSLSPENWIPITSAARLGFLGKGALGMKALHKASPSLARKAAAQADDIMDEAFIQAARRSVPGITDEQIRELAIKRLLAGSPLSHKVGATAIEGMLTAAIAEPFYHMDQPLRTKQESAAIIIGSGVLGGGFGLVFGGLGSAYGKVLGDKLGDESMIDFRFSLEESIGRELNEVSDRLEEAGLPTMLETLSEELGVSRAELEAELDPEARAELEAELDSEEVLEQVAFETLDNPMAVEAAEKRAEIINEVISGRDPNSPIAKLVGLGNDTTWFGKLLARTLMWSPNLRSAWTITAAEDMLYQRLGANAMTRGRGAADQMGDLTEPSMDTAETLASMEGLRRVIALSDEYNNRKGELGNLTEDEFRSLVAKAARREVFDPEELVSLDAEALPDQLVGSRVYDHLEGKTPEQVAAIQDAVEAAVKDHYTPYIDEVTKVFQAVGMIPDGELNRKHAARYVTRQYDKSLISANTPQFKAALRRGLLDTQERELPILEKRLEWLDDTLAEYRELLTDPEMTPDDLVELRNAIDTFDKMRAATQEDMNALGVVGDAASLEALLDQVVRNITDDRVVPSRNVNNALESSLMARVLDLEDKFIEPYLVNDISLGMVSSVRKHFPKVVAFRYLASADQVRSIAVANEKMAEYDDFYARHKDEIESDRLSDGDADKLLGIANDLLFELNFLNMHNGITTLAPTRNSIGGADRGAIPVVDGAGNLDVAAASARVRQLLEMDRADGEALQSVLAEIRDIKEALSGPQEPAPMGHPGRRTPRVPQVSREPSSLAHPLLMEDIARRLLIDHADEVARRTAEDPGYQASAARVGALAHEIEQTFDRSQYTNEEILELDARVVGDAPAKVRAALDDSYDTKKELHRSRENEDGGVVGQTIQRMTKGQYLSFVVNKVLHTRVRFDPSTSKYIFPTELTDVATPKLLNAILDNSEGGYIYSANQASLPRGQHMFQPDTLVSIIQGFNRADASTALHEQMHAIRKTVFTKKYLSGGHGDITQQDVDKAATWSAAQAGEALTKGEDGDYVWTRKMEEAFADGFEVYIMEGTAPTNALKRAFQALSDILKTIYERSMRLGHINLSPEMRGVYDKVVQRGEFLEKNNHPVSPLTDAQKQDVVRAFNLTGEGEIGAVHTILDSMGLRQELVTYESPTAAEFIEGLRERRREHQVLRDEAAQRRNEAELERGRRDDDARNMGGVVTDEDGITHWQDDIEWDGDVGVLWQEDMRFDPTDPPDFDPTDPMDVEFENFDEDVFEHYMALEEEARQSIGEGGEPPSRASLMREAQQVVAAEREMERLEKARADALAGAEAASETDTAALAEAISNISEERVIRLEELLPPSGEPDPPGQHLPGAFPKNHPVDSARTRTTERQRKRNKEIDEETARGFAANPAAWISDTMKAHGEHINADLSTVQVSDIGLLLEAVDLLYSKEFATLARQWASQATPEEILTSPQLIDLAFALRGEAGATRQNLRLYDMRKYDGDTSLAKFIGESGSGERMERWEKGSGRPGSPLPLPEIMVPGDLADPRTAGRWGNEFNPGAGDGSRSGANFYVRTGTGELRMIGSSNMNIPPILKLGRGPGVRLVEFNGNKPHVDGSSRSEGAKSIANALRESPTADGQRVGTLEGINDPGVTDGEQHIPGMDGLSRFFWVGDYGPAESVKTRLQNQLNERMDRMSDVDPEYVADLQVASRWIQHIKEGRDADIALTLPFLHMSSDTGIDPEYRGSARAFRGMLDKGFKRASDVFAWQAQFAPNTWYQAESKMFLGLLGAHLAEDLRLTPISHGLARNDIPLAISLLTDSPSVHSAEGQVSDNVLRTVRDILAGADVEGRIGQGKAAHGESLATENASNGSESVVLRPGLHEGVSTELKEQGIKKVLWESRFESGEVMEFGIESSSRLEALGLGENVGVIDMTRLEGGPTLDAMTIAIQRMRPYNPMEIAIKMDPLKGGALAERLGMEQVGEYFVTRAEDFLMGMAANKPPLPDFFRYTTNSVTLPLCNMRLQESLHATFPTKQGSSRNPGWNSGRRTGRRIGQGVLGDYVGDQVSPEASLEIDEFEGGGGLKGRGSFLAVGGGLGAMSPYHQTKSLIHGTWKKEADGSFVRRGSAGFMDRTAASFLDSSGDEPVLRTLDDFRASMRDKWLPGVVEGMKLERDDLSRGLRESYPYLDELVESVEYEEEWFLADFEKAKDILRARRGDPVYKHPTMGNEDWTKPATIKDAISQIKSGNWGSGAGFMYLEMAFELARSVNLGEQIKPLRRAIDTLHMEYKRLSQSNPEWMMTRDKAQAVAGGMNLGRSGPDGMFGEGNPSFELSKVPLVEIGRGHSGRPEIPDKSWSMEDAVLTDLFNGADGVPEGLELPALERLDGTARENLTDQLREDLGGHLDDEHHIYALSDGSGAIAINHDGVVVKLAEGLRGGAGYSGLDLDGVNALLMNMAILNGAKGIVLPGIDAVNFRKSSGTIKKAAALGFVPIGFTRDESGVDHAVMALQLFGRTDRTLDSTGDPALGRQDTSGVLGVMTQQRQHYESVIERGGIAGRVVDTLDFLERPTEAGGKVFQALNRHREMHTDTANMIDRLNPTGTDSEITSDTLRHALPRLGHIYTLLKGEVRSMVKESTRADIPQGLYGDLSKSAARAYRDSQFSGLREVRPESATAMIVDHNAKNNIGRLLKSHSTEGGPGHRTIREGDSWDLADRDLTASSPLEEDSKGAGKRPLQPFFALAQGDIPEMDYDASLRRKSESGPRGRLDESSHDRLVELGREAYKRNQIAKSIKGGTPQKSVRGFIGDWRASSASVGRSAILPDSMRASKAVNENVAKPDGAEFLSQDADGAALDIDTDTESAGLMDRLEVLQGEAAGIRERSSANRRLLGEIARDLGTGHDANSGARNGAAPYAPLPYFRRKAQGSNMGTIQGADSILRMHARRIKGETFKDGISLESQFAEIEREYAPLLREADENGKSSTGHTRKQLIKRKSITKKDAQAMRDRVLGTHGMDTDASEFAMRLSSTARDFNYLRMMGGVALSSMPDIAMAISTAGLRNYMGAWGEFLKGNLTSEGMDKDGIAYMMYAAETVLGDHRAQKTNMIDEDIDHTYSWGERKIKEAAHKFGKISGIQHWNGTMKAIAASAIQSRMLEIGYKIERGVASDLEKEMLRQFGVSPAEAARAASIHRRVGETGRTATGKEFHHTRIDRWDGGIGSMSAEEVARSRNLWRMAVVQAVNRTIVTPSVGDLPLIATGSPWGKMLFQFKSFTLAATQQVLISGMQRGAAYGDISQLVLLMSLTSVGTMVYASKELMAGRDPFERKDWQMKMLVEGLDRGGALGVLSEVNQIAEKVAGFGLSNLTDSGPLTRYMKRNKLDAILGPSYGLFGDLLEAGGVAPQWLTGREEVSKGQATAMRRLLPWQNLLQTRFLLDILPNATGRGGYFDDFKNIQERIRTGDFY